jgi:hypothetical protein
LTPPRARRAEQLLTHRPPQLVRSGIIRRAVQRTGTGSRMDAEGMATAVACVLFLLAITVFVTKKSW